MLYTGAFFLYITGNQQISDDLMPSFHINHGSICAHYNCLSFCVVLVLRPLDLVMMQQFFTGMHDSAI